MWKTTTFYGWNLKNLFETCESRALAKLQQKDKQGEKGTKQDAQTSAT